jgi:hypothetical protein
VHKDSGRLLGGFSWAHAVLFRLTGVGGNIFNMSKQNQGKSSIEQLLPEIDKR